MKAGFFASLNRAQRLILAVAWMGWVFDIMDTALFNFAKTPMVRELLGASSYRLHGPAVEGQIQVVFLIGWSIGGAAFGFFADRCGRTRALALSIAVYCLYTGVTGLCASPGEVAFARFLTGLGIGGEWAAGTALVAEALPDDARAGAAAWLQTAAAFGPALAALAAVLLRSQSWRWLFAIGVLPALVLLIVRARVQEPAPSQAENRPPPAPGQSKPPWTRNLLIATLIGLVGIAGANNLAFWMPNLIREASAALPEAAQQARVGIATWVMHIGTLAGVFVFPWLCNQWGRRPAFFTFLVASPPAFCLLLASKGSYQTLLILLPLLSFLVIGLTAGFALYFPELFPRCHRATGLGIAYNSSRLATIPFPWALGLIVTQFGSAKALVASSAVNLVGLATLAFAPETKGRQLPDG